MFARRQFENDLRLPETEMAIVLRRRNGKIERRQFGVDDQMMVTGSGTLDPGGRDTHLAESKPHRDGRLDRLARGRRNKIDHGIGRPIASGQSRISNGRTRRKQRSGEAGRHEKK